MTIIEAEKIIKAYSDFKQLLWKADELYGFNCLNFMLNPNPKFDNRRPVDVAREDENGIDKLKAILTSEYGIDFAEVEKCFQK